MSVADELAKLDELRTRGVLTAEEFERAKAKLLRESEVPPAVAAVNNLRRSTTDRWIGGVCGGLARLSGLAAWFWRIVFVALTMCAGGGMLLYFLLWIFVPIED